MGFLVEEYKWDKLGDWRYYHLEDGKIVKTTSYKNDERKDDSLFEVTETEDNEVKRKRSRKRRDEWRTLWLVHRNGAIWI